MTKIVSLVQFRPGTKAVSADVNSNFELLRSSHNNQEDRVSLLESTSYEHQAKLHTLNISIRDYGAVGDGITDDTTAVQNWLDAVCNSGGKAILESGKTYKITSPIVTNTGNGVGVYIDFNGAVIKPAFILGVNSITTYAVTINPESTDYDAKANIDLKNIQIDCSNTPYFQTVSSSDIRGISPLQINGIGKVKIDGYYVNDSFFGKGLAVRNYNQLDLSNVIMVNVGSKYSPTTDYSGAYDTGGDGIYLGNAVNNAVTHIKNVNASSYTNYYGRGGIVIEDLQGLTTSHDVVLDNVRLVNYHRTIHQEDGGKARIVWNGGYASGFACACFALQATRDFIVTGVTFDVNSPFTYNGNSGLTNLYQAPDGKAIFNGCAVNYSGNSVQEWGSQVFNSCRINFGCEVVKVGADILQLNDCNVTTTGGRIYFPAGSDTPVLLNNSIFKNTSASLVHIVDVNNKPIKATSCKFVFCDVINTNSRALHKNNQFIGCQFLYENLSAELVLFQGFNTVNQFRDCEIKATGSYVKVYGETVDNSFYNCELRNSKLHFVNGAGDSDAADYCQVTGCKCVYLDGYTPTVIADFYAPCVVYQNNYFIDKTAGQAITTPNNSYPLEIKITGLGNVMRKNSTITVL